jgi:hypothetical protein
VKSAVTSRTRCRATNADTLAYEDGSWGTGAAGGVRSPPPQAPLSRAAAKVITGVARTVNRAKTVSGIEGTPVRPSVFLVLILSRGREEGFGRT